MMTMAWTRICGWWWRRAACVPLQTVSTGMRCVRVVGFDAQLPITLYVQQDEYPHHFSIRFVIGARMYMRLSAVSKHVSRILSFHSPFCDFHLYQAARIASRRHYHSKCTHTHNGGEKKGMVFHHHQLEKVRQPGDSSAYIACLHPRCA